MPLPLPEFMRVVLVNAPAADVQAQRAALLIEQAVKQLCRNQPAYECIVIPGKERAGTFSFLQKQRQQQAIMKLDPDVVLYASPFNLLPVKTLKTAVLVTGLNNSSQIGLLKKQRSKLSAIITDSMQLKTEIAESFKIDEGRIQIVQLIEESIDENPATNPETREKFTSGHEYFFYGGYIGENSNWGFVLQAFSQFKKWQQSGLQLVIAGVMETAYQQGFQEKLDTYKYRHDVICLNDAKPAEKNELVAAAFNVMDEAETFEGRMNILNAFRTGIPVIVHKNAMAEEFCGEAALYADFRNAGNLSQQMISLYKNEDAYTRLASKGKIISSHRTSAQMLSQLNHSLLTAIKQ